MNYFKIFFLTFIISASAYILIGTIYTKDTSWVHLAVYSIATGVGAGAGVVLMFKIRNKKT